MPLPLFRRKADKDKADKSSKNLSSTSLPRNTSSNSVRRVATPPIVEQEERYVEYNVEPETSKAPAPDTRMLKSLGGCAVQVSTVETFDTPLPYLDYARRDSSMSAYSTASTNLTTPTFSRNPEWEHNVGGRQVSLSATVLFSNGRAEPSLRSPFPRLSSKTTSPSTTRPLAIAGAGRQTRRLISTSFST